MFTNIDLSFIYNLNFHGGKSFLYFIWTVNTWEYFTKAISSPMKTKVKLKTSTKVNSRYGLALNKELKRCLTHWFSIQPVHSIQHLTISVHLPGATWYLSREAVTFMLTHSPSHHSTAHTGIGTSSLGNNSTALLQKPEF